MTLKSWLENRARRFEIVDLGDRNWPDGQQIRRSR